MLSGVNELYDMYRLVRFTQAVPGVFIKTHLIYADIFDPSDLSLMSSSSSYLLIFSMRFKLRKADFVFNLD